MYTKISKYAFLPIIALVMVMAAFLLVSPVSADDGQPVDPVVAPEVVVETTEEGAALEAIPPVVDEPTVVEPAPTDEPVEVEQPVVEEVTPSAEEPTPLVEVVDSLAEADVVIAAPSGRSTSMGTNAASDAAIAGDPYYTVGTTTYRFVKTADAGVCGGDIGVTCFASETPIQDAIDSMGYFGTPTDRKLYIEDDTYSEDVTINGSIGGPSGLLSLVGLGDEPAKVTIDGSIWVLNMVAGFTINNVRVENDDPLFTDNAAIWIDYTTRGAVNLVDVEATATGQDSSGIFVESTGNVTLNRVNASGNGYHGTRIFYPTGTVSIINSVFEDNLNLVDDGYYWYDSAFDDSGPIPGSETPAYAGLMIDNTLPVTLNGVTVQGNYGDGVDIVAGNAVTTVKNSVFSHNFGVDTNSDGFDEWGDGLFISGKSIIMENLSADDNGLGGVHLYADTSVVGKGLWINNNDDTGLSITTCFDYGDADPYCDNPGAGTVSLTTVASIGSREGSGIDIYSKGAVTITDTFAGWNSDYGYRIDSTDAQTPAATTLKIAKAYGNGIDGLYIASKGAISLFDIIMRDNIGNGLTINHEAPTAITVSNNANQFNETGHNGWSYDEIGDVWTNTDGYGYNIYTWGPVSITNLDAMDNGGLGGLIDNSDAVTAAPVTLSLLVSQMRAVNAYDNNGDTGLIIFSRGGVTINNIRANNNLQGGLFIENVPPGTVTGVPVTINNSEFYGNIYDAINDIPGNGLVIDSKGAVTLLNTGAGDNQGYGVYIDNSKDGSSAGVTINAGTGWVNEFARNWDDGLFISSRGAVSITNMDAYENGGSGVFIETFEGLGGVTIKDTRTSGGGQYRNNTEDGINIRSKGAVSIMFQQANWNGGYGIIVDTHQGTGAVSLLGKYAEVQGNGHDLDVSGIRVYSQGNIILTGITSRWNNNYGASLNNDGLGNITITRGYFDENESGLTAISKGTITWNNGSASGNTGNGAQLINQPADLAKAVTLTNIQASNNGATGIYIDSKGAVTVTNSVYNNNSINGGTIALNDLWHDNLTDNQSWWYESVDGADVTIDFSSSNVIGTVDVFDENGGYITSGTADGDGNLALAVDLTNPGLYQIFIRSDREALWPYTIGIYETANPGVYSNRYATANGLSIYNAYQFQSAVMVTNTYNDWSSNNSGTNLSIQSSGAVTVTNIDLNDSGDSGLHISNDGDTTPSAVTISGLNFYNNQINAIYLQSNGIVTLKNVRADNTQQGYGIYIDNFVDTLAPAAVNMTNVTVYGSGENAIEITSKGAVTLVNVESRWSANRGISIYTLGNVSFNDVDAYENSQYGAYVQTNGTFTILTPTDGTYNYFGNNGRDGLYVSAGNRVTLTKVYAIYNGFRDENGLATSQGYGIRIFNNINPTGLAPVSLTWVYADNNTETGVYISTTSAVTLSKIIADNNDDNGIFLTQQNIPVLYPTVTLSSISAYGNGYNGIDVIARGNITVSKLDASDNGNSGAVLDNSLGKGTVTILATGGPNYVSFNNNGYGMNINASGAVTISGVEYHGNSLTGLRVDNSTAALPAAITVNTVSAQGNNAEGIVLLSDGIVTVNSSYIVNNAI